MQPEAHAEPDEILLHERVDDGGRAFFTELMDRCAPVDSYSIRSREPPPARSRRTSCASASTTKRPSTAKNPKSLHPDRR
jgi:hypothetical protein